MSAQTTDVYSGNLRPQDSDEIDVRRYLLVLVKWWREILLITILAGVVTGLTLASLDNNEPPVYTARADILIARLLSSIELDARVDTAIGANQGDPNAWRTSLLQLVSSIDVATAVFDELQDELPDAYQRPESLISTVAAAVPYSADERYASNIIRIAATTGDPELSALIANSWARHMVDYINGLYGEVPASVIESVTAERDQALLDYQAAEKAYEQFVATNQTDLLTRQINEKTTLRNEIMVNYTRILTSVVSSEYLARLDLYSTMASAPLEHSVAVIEAHSDGRVKTLGLLYGLHASAIAQLNQARIMERTLVEGGEAAAKSNGAALQMLKLATFASVYGNESFSATLPMMGEAQSVAMTLEEQLEDVRALVVVLEGYVAQLEEDIAQLGQSGMSGTDLIAIVDAEDASAAPPAEGAMTPGGRAAEAYAQLLASDGVLTQAPIDSRSIVSDAHEELLTTLEADIRTLQAALAAEDAKRRELVHLRDLAWTSYETVGNKLEELSLLRSSANSEVRVGSPAIVPRASEPQNSPVIPVVAVTLLAFFAAVVLALLFNSFGVQPFFSRRTA